MLCIDGFNYKIQDNNILNINRNKILQIITVCFIYKKMIWQTMFHTKNFQVSLLPPTYNVQPGYLLIHLFIMYIHVYQVHESSLLHMWDLPFYLTFKLSKGLHTMWASIMLKFICHCKRVDTETLKVSRS